MATEHEIIFFSRAKSLAEYCQTDEGYATYDTYYDFAQPFSSLVQNLIDEFINNCTKLTGIDRTIYINRLLTRLKNINEELPPSNRRTRLYYGDLADKLEYLLEKLKMVAVLYENDSKSLEYGQENKGFTTLKDQMQQHLYEILQENGFFQLSSTSTLSIEGKNSVIKLLLSNKTPYIIAMFDHLGFLKELESLYKTKTKVYKNIAIWLGGSDQTGDGIKKYILSLNSKSRIDRKRYNALIHVESVKKDFEILKKGGNHIF